jgi:hypothetical protein
MMDEIKSESSLDAKAPVIDPGLPLCGDFDHFPIANGVQLELATASAESAGGLYSIQLPCTAFDGAEILS